MFKIIDLYYYILIHVSYQQYVHIFLISILTLL